jgi:RimJ/RimL family protein N-acetyltransferase
MPANAGNNRSKIVSDHPAHAGKIRKLWPTETDKFRDHLLRLDKESRRLRFGHGVSDAFIEDYAARMCDLGSIVFGCFEGSDVRAVAELRKLAETWGQEAEAGFSIESTHQDLGIGTELMGRVIDSARNRGVQRLYLSCLLENRRMQAIARKYEAELRFEHGEVIGEIMPTGATYFSLMSEAVDDRVSFMLAVLDLQSRLVRVA